MVQIKSYFFVLAAFLVALTSGFSQEKLKKHSARFYRKNPVWIQMMNDPQANYFETIKAFREYWKNKALPKEEFENGKPDEFEKEVGLVNSEKEEKEREGRLNNTSSILYADEVRAFKGWIQSNKDWIRSDGSIIPENERQQIINSQQSELKIIEKNNGKK